MKFQLSLERASDATILYDVVSLLLLSESIHIIMPEDMDL